MDEALADIVNFLRASPPFDTLSEQELAQYCRKLSVRYLRRGTPVPPEADAEPAVYILRSGSLDIRSETGQLLAKLAEGELYADACLNRADADWHARMAEDGLVYELSCADFDALRATHVSVERMFLGAVGARLGHALREMRQGTESPAVTLGGLAVAELAGAEPLVIPPDLAIDEAARRMTRAGVSAAVVMDGETLYGLLTDTDFRARVLAESIPPGQPVSEVMTRSVETVAADAPALEALLTMLEHNVHHLPVMGGAQGVGLLSTDDFMRHMTVSGLFLMREVAHCDTLEALVEISREIPVLQAQLVRAGANGLQVGEALSALWDAVTRRLIQLALTQMGPAPAPFAWLAIGSLARREIMAHADQDNALLYADRVESERDRQWFLTLGRYVTHGLAECGLTLCPGDVMARTPEWCQPLSVWKGYFDDWIGHPEPKSVMLTCNFFDARIVYGDELLFANLQTHALNKAQGNSIYLAHLAANATHHRPPLGFFRQFVLIDEGDHAQTLDIKQGGVMPIVELARVHAVASGSTAVHTLKRLQAGAAGGMLSDDMLRDLSMAYELIVTLRARHQAEQIGRGEAPDNYLSPGAIGQLDRSYLKQAFALIKTAQDSLAMRYQTERLR